MPTLAKKEVPRTKQAERMLEVCPVSKVDVLWRTLDLPWFVDEQCH
jgi:hypothetical protein